MRFQVILATRTTEKMNDLLSIFCFTHFDASVKASAFALVSCPSEARASSSASAARYGSTEHVNVLSVVESENKLIQVERQILAANLVIGAHDAALEQTPKRFNIVGMNVAANIFPIHMANGSMLVFVAQIPVSARFIGRNQVNFRADSLANELIKSLRVGKFDHLANDVALARNRANDGHLVATASDSASLVPMAVLVLSANVGFIDFDNTHELLKLRISHASAQPVADVPRRSIRARAHHAVNLKSRHAFLARKHVVKNLEPSKQGIVRVLENRSNVNREPIVALPVIVANPMERARLQRVDFFRSAPRTLDAIRPSAILHVHLARRVIREHEVEFGKRDLFDSFVCHAKSITRN
jgi:hypothetical protein